MNFFRKVKFNEWYLLFAAILLYIAVFSFFSISRHLSSALGDPDFSIFDQSFYTALKHGLPFYNTFEASSHFAKHLSPIFYLLLPFYAIYPDIITLNIMQSAALAVGAVPVYLIAKEYFAGKTPLLFSCLYLLYHPLHGINYDQFNELSFAVAPLLFALYYFIKKKYAAFWIFFILALLCKEDASFVAVFWGLYGLGFAFLQKRPSGHNAEEQKKLLVTSVMLLFVGAMYLYFSLYVIIPYFQGGKYIYFTERYSTFGASFHEVARNIVFHPVHALKVLFQKEKLAYFFELFLPLGFTPFISPGLLVMSFPTFFINMLSDNSSMYNSGNRYSAYIIPFLFGAAIMGVDKLLKNVKTDKKDKVKNNIMAIMFTLTILCSLFLNNTPLRSGFKVPVVTEHQEKILALAKTLPKDASISTQVDILQHVCHRVHAYSGYYAGSEFILVDEKTKWYSMHARWDENLPKILSLGKYEKIYDEDGIKLYRLKK